MKKCPYCAELIQEEAIVCRFCNRDLVEKDQAAPPIQSPKKERKGNFREESPIAYWILIVALLFFGGLAISTAISFFQIRSFSRQIDAFETTETAASRIIVEQQTQAAETVNLSKTATQEALKEVINYPISATIIPVESPKFETITLEDDDKLNGYCYTNIQVTSSPS